jgi:hypothetical protein
VHSFVIIGGFDQHFILKWAIGAMAVVVVGLAVMLMRQRRVGR